MQAAKTTNEVYRIFVGGLSFEVDNHLLKESFQRFGGLKKALVIRDQRSGQSKGYGFVTFTGRGSFEAALRSPVFVLGRLADCHPVLTKGALKDQEQRDFSNKIFVGGVSQSVTAEDLRRYFSQFGKIKDARILYDGRTGKSRGFGFVLLERVADVDSVLAVEIHKIKKKPVEVKRFNKENETEINNAQMSNNFHNKQTEGEYPILPDTSTHPENKRQIKPQRKKAQKTKQNSFETMSTISEKEYPFNDESQKFNNVQHEMSNNHDQEMEECQDQEPISQRVQFPTESKPNFTLSGFFSYKQSFDPFSTSSPFSRDNTFGPRSGFGLPLGSSSYCHFNPIGPAWTPSLAMQARPRQSRPVPIGNYNY